MTRRSSLVMTLFSMLAAAGPARSLHAEPYPIPLVRCGERSGDAAAKLALAQRVTAAQRFMDQKTPGVTRATAELADQACRVGDREALNQVFERCVRECTDPGDLYIAHLSYANALERFGDAAAAESHFRQAIAGRRGAPIEALEAYNSLALLLDRAGRAQDALNVLSVFSATDVEHYSVVATLRMWFMRELKMDTTAAEAALNRGLRGVTGAQSGAPAGLPPGVRSEPVLRTTDVTIEVVADVRVEPWGPGRERVPGHLYFFRVAVRDRAGFQPQFQIARGQRFRMVAELAGGSCRIEHENRAYDVDTCPWLGVPDASQPEFFRVPQ